MATTRNGAAKASASAERFIEVWQKSSSQQEVADVLGVSKQAVSTRAYLYRRRGIPMKHMPRGGRVALNLSALSALAKKFAPKE